MKLATDNHHVNESCCKGFQGQNEAKCTFPALINLRPSVRCTSGGGIQIDGVASFAVRVWVSRLS